jgi:hypothetical protein
MYFIGGSVATTQAESLKQLSTPLAAAAAQQPRLITACEHLGSGCDNETPLRCVSFKGQRRGDTQHFINALQFSQNTTNLKQKWFLLKRKVSFSLFLSVSAIFCWRTQLEPC